MGRVGKDNGDNGKSLIFFVLAAVFLFLAVIVGIDYGYLAKVCNSELQDIQYVEGAIETIDTVTNTVLVIEGCDKQFYIRTERIQGNDIKVGDVVRLHYADSTLFRKNHYEIVNFEWNDKTIYSIEQYKKTNDITLLLVLLIVASVVAAGLIVAGAVLLIHNKTKYKREKASGNNGIAGLRETKEQQPSQDELIDKFRGSLYTQNGRTYTSGPELVENDEYGDVFAQVLAETAVDDEVKVIFDDTCRDDGAVFVVSRINGKTAVLYLIADEETGKFPIENNELYFMFEKNDEPTTEEKKAFVRQIDRYNRYREDIFVLQ